ncbi:hypothetical protein B188_00340 [Candidatus Brocadiaceae bacterium B188]|nr:hypothetical protein B188_00340 [Candidatus Brocadiaceae bacterium B188]
MLKVLRQDGRRILKGKRFKYGYLQDFSNLTRCFRLTKDPNK